MGTYLSDSTRPTLRAILLLLLSLPFFWAAAGPAPQQNTQTAGFHPGCLPSEAARRLAAGDFEGALAICTRTVGIPPAPPVPAPIPETPRLPSVPSAPSPLPAAPAPRLSAPTPTGPAPAATSLLEEEARPIAEGDCALIGAKALLGLGRAAEAERLLDGREDLDAWGTLLLAEARLAAGAEEGAILRLLAEVEGAGSVVEKRARRLRLQVDAASPEAGRAIPALQSLAREKGPRQAEYRLALAERLLAAGRKSDGLRELWTLYAEHPESKASARAALLLRDHPIPLERRLERARRLLDLGFAKEAAEALEAIVDPPAAQRGAIAILRSRALADAGERGKAELSLLQVIDELEGRERNEALVLAARFAARRRAVHPAVQRLDSVGSGEARFLAAFLLYDGGFFDEARERFAKLATEGHRRDEVLWHLAWMHVLEGAWPEAVQALDRLLRQTPRSELVTQARYWRARALAAQGKEEEATRAFRQIVSERPTDWYALLARRHLPQSPTSASAAPKMERPKQAPPSPLARAARLYCLGFREEATAEVQAALPRLRPTRSLLEQATWIAADGDDPNLAFRLALRWRGGGLHPFSYPRAFAPAVEAAAAESGVAPEVLWAVMRQESAFSPSARSPRAAQGLLQLLPTTAARVAEDFALGVGPEPRLGDPLVNARLGAHYLAALLHRFDGNLPLALAAYNAGPAAVLTWLEDPMRAELPLDAFVDAIPWRETRNYVKTVMSNLAAYRHIYGGPTPTVPTALPTVRDGVDY